MVTFETLSCMIFQIDEMQAVMFLLIDVAYIASRSRRSFGLGLK